MSEEKLQEHLSSPFYKKAKKFWEAVRIGQIHKGAEKYDEPFTPSSWTNEELVVHAIQENVDQLHYIIGMKERMEEQQRTIDELHNEIINQKFAIKGLLERLRKYEG